MNDKYLRVSGNLICEDSCIGSSNRFLSHELMCLNDDTIIFEIYLVKNFC